MPRIYTKKPPEDRFWAKVRTGDKCWEWVGAIADTGYGIFTVSTKIHVSTHRFSYQLHYGTIPDGLWVLHRCDNRRCVRPDHLFLGTALDNVRDMDKKGRRRNVQVRGAKHHFAKLTPSDVATAKSLWKNRGLTGRSAKGFWTLHRLAAKFGVSSATMYYALIGRSWND